jgi:hypothetical protein
LTSTHDALAQLRQDVLLDIYLLRLCPIIDDLDAAVRDQIRIYRHENRGVRAPETPAVIAGRIREMNAKIVAERLSDGNMRRSLYRRYKRELSEDRYRHVASVHRRYWSCPHRNAVLLLGVGGLTKSEARTMTGQTHVNYDRIARQLNLAAGE